VSGQPRFRFLCGSHALRHSSQFLSPTPQGLVNPGRPASPARRQSRLCAGQHAPTGLSPAVHARVPLDRTPRPGPTAAFAPVVGAPDDADAVHQWHRPATRASTATPPEGRATSVGLLVAGSRSGRHTFQRRLAPTGRRQVAHSLRSRWLFRRNPDANV
jgi:hypothetical protein